MPAKLLKTQRKAQVALAAKQDPCCICLQKFNAKDEILFCAGKVSTVSRHSRNSVQKMQNRFSAFAASKPRRRSRSILYKPR